MYKLVLSFAFFWLSASLFAQNTQPLWQDTDDPIRPAAERVITPKAYRVLQLNTAAMHELLQGAPDESAANASVSSYTLELPRPDGRMEAFRFC